MIAKRGGEQYYSNMKPESHQDVFHVRVAPRRLRPAGPTPTPTPTCDGCEGGPLVGAAREADRAGRGWAWEMHATTVPKMINAMISYGSSTLRIAVRTPEGDFWPRADAGQQPPPGRASHGVPFIAQHQPLLLLHLLLLLRPGIIRQFAHSAPVNIRLLLLLLLNPPHLSRLSTSITLST